MFMLAIAFFVFVIIVFHACKQHYKRRFNKAKYNKDESRRKDLE